MTVGGNPKLFGRHVYYLRNDLLEKDKQIKEKDEICSVFYMFSVGGVGRDFGGCDGLRGKMEKRRVIRCNHWQILMINNGYYATKGVYTYPKA